MQNIVFKMKDQNVKLILSAGGRVEGERRGLRG
jgi:hypothetical protein